MAAVDGAAGGNVGDAEDELVVDVIRVVGGKVVGGKVVGDKDVGDKVEESVVE